MTFLFLWLWLRTEVSKRDSNVNFFYFFRHEIKLFVIVTLDTGPSAERLVNTHSSMLIEFTVSNANKRICEIKLSHKLFASVKNYWIDEINYTVVIDNIAHKDIYQFIGLPTYNLCLWHSRRSPAIAVNALIYSCSRKNRCFNTLTWMLANPLRS